MGTSIDFANDWLCLDNLFSLLMWRACQNKKEKKKSAQFAWQKHSKNIFIMGIVFKNGSLKMAHFVLREKSTSVNVCSYVNIYSYVLLPQFFISFSYSSGLSLFTFYLVEVNYYNSSKYLSALCEFSNQEHYYFFFLRVNGIIWSVELQDYFCFLLYIKELMFLKKLCITFE